MTQQLISFAQFAPPANRGVALEIPELRAATFADYPQIALLEAGNGLRSQPLSDWKSLWLDNPTWQALHGTWPIGWVMENPDGRLVGALTNVPSSYMFEGRRLICANGRGWVVDRKYRGYSMWLMDEFLGQPDAQLFIATTVGQSALPTWSHVGRRIPVGDWCAAKYWITGYRGFAGRVLSQKNAPAARLFAPVAAAGLWAQDLLRRRLPHAPQGIRIEQTDRFDARFDELWRERLSRGAETLLGVRDAATLRWHFAVPMRRKDLWIFTASRGQTICAYCVFKRQPQSNGLRRMRLVDYQSIDSHDDLQPGLLRAALRRSRIDKVDLLENLGVGVPKMRAFDRYAPRSRSLDTWSFFFRAADPSLDELLRRPDPWEPSVFDGDASFE